MDCHVECENEVSYGESVLAFQRVDVDLPLSLKEGLELLHFFSCIRQLKAECRLVFQRTVELVRCYKAISLSNDRDESIYLLGHLDTNLVHYVSPHIVC